VSQAQTKSQREWRAYLAQERIDRAIALLRNAQQHLHTHRIHDMPRLLIASGERMVKLRLDALWDAQQGKEQLKPVEAGYGISDRT
jgi:hypothetical protein